MQTKQEMIDHLYNEYGYKFPMKARYKRSSNRIYFMTDFKDNELIEFFWYCDKPSSNAKGYAYYKNEKGFSRLIHIDEIESA